MSFSKIIRRFATAALLLAAPRIALSQDSAGFILTPQPQVNQAFAIQNIAPEVHNVSAANVENIMQRLDYLETALDMERRKSASENFAIGENVFETVGIQTKPSFKINGRIFMDHIMYDDSAFVNRQNETGFDTARIGANGNVFENLKYKLEVEFEGTEVDYKDVYIEVNNLPWVGNIRYGHFKEPFSLEELTSSRFLTWMERSIGYQAFVPQRNFGLMLHDSLACNENISWFSGIFRGDFDDSPTAQGSEVQDDGDWVFTSRIAWLPYYDEPSGGRYLVHLGAAYSYRTTGGTTRTFTARPELGTEGANIATTIDDTWSLFGTEAAIVWGPSSLQAEYYHVDSAGLTLNGGYFQASYFLTGEHRAYKRSSKAFDRVHPIENAFWVCTENGVCRGLGAWELKLRWSWVDLNAGTGATRGYQDDISAGLNWYINPYTRMMFDYIYEDIDRVGGLDSHANNFGMRFQIDY